MTLDYLWWWCSSSVTLVSVKYSFIAITPRFTLIQNGSICNCPINGSNRSFWKLCNCLWSFLSLLLSSSLQLFPQSFGCLQMFVELVNLYETSPVLIPLAITGYKYSFIVTRLQSRLNLQPPDDCLLRGLGNQRLWPLRCVSCWTF